MNKDFLFRFVALGLAFLQPLIILLCHGTHVVSISSMWGTNLQPFFIITNALTSYYFFQTKDWYIPSVFLLFLTAFSVNLFPMVHNILALCFFFSVLYPLWLSRIKIFILLYLISIPFLLFGRFFWMEFWAVNVMCIYHIRSIYIFWKYEHRNI